MTPMELLRAVADGSVVRVESERQRGYWATYTLTTGEPVERWALNSLKKQAWIDMPMIGPPTITPDGLKRLAAEPDRGRHPN